MGRGRSREPLPGPHAPSLRLKSVAVGKRGLALRVFTGLLGQPGAAVAPAITRTRTTGAWGAPLAGSLLPGWLRTERDLGFRELLVDEFGSWGSGEHCWWSDCCGGCRTDQWSRFGQRVHEQGIGMHGGLPEGSWSGTSLLSTHEKLLRRKGVLGQAAWPNRLSVRAVSKSRCQVGAYDLSLGA